MYSVRDYFFLTVMVLGVEQENNSKKPLPFFMEGLGHA